MNPYWFVLAATLFVNLMVFVRWLHRITRDNEISRGFVRDMAINHLPYVYHSLRALAAKHGIELPDPPPLRFVEVINNKNGRDR
jgi:hypothetical protein